MSIWQPAFKSVYLHDLVAFLGWGQSTLCSPFLKSCVSGRNKGKPTYAFFRTLAKRYDSVWHSGLLYRLHEGVLPVAYGT
jgi:hypothetical protein